MITARNLSKRYGRHHAVADLSFDVHPGHVTGFLGPNGAGKSTTLRLMLGLDRGQGETRFDGRRFRELRDPLREVGCVLDARSFHPTRTAANHLWMLAVAADLPRSRVDEVLGIVGLADVAGEQPKGFSLGMCQRLGLAAALLGDPHTLILDEPANGLDPQGIQWLRRFLQDFAATGRTVLVSSHLMAEMDLMADALVVIGRGQLIAHGSVDDFVARFSERHVFVKSPQAGYLAELLALHAVPVKVLGPYELTLDGASAAQVGELAAAHGIRLHELSTRSSSLEDAFLAATAEAVEFEGVSGRWARTPVTGPRVG